MTRRKFKVGDKVVTKKANGARPVGSVGKVVGYSNRLYKLEFDDYYMVYGYYTGSELDAFVEPKTTPKKEEPKFKVGDRVKVICTDDGARGAVIGDTGTIMTIKEVKSTNSYKMEDDNGRWYWYLNAIEGKVIEYPEEVKKEEPKYLEDFEKGKTYIFDKHIFERREGYCPSWATECHDKVVEVASSFHGEVSVFSISPCWCKETEYYFGKVVCVENYIGNKHLYAVGKIYNIENGVLIADNGSKITNYHDEPFKSVDELNGFSLSKFIEVVE